MKILFLAPQPFLQERGSPIAVNLVLQGLSERGDNIDLVTYFEGQDVHYDNVTLFRTPALSLLRNIRPGFSWQKLICDLLMLLQVFALVLKNRYDLVWAVEEMSFLALFLKFMVKIPYVYDMDSSLAQQMVEQFPRLRYFSSLLEFFEKLVVKYATTVIPVCDALAEDIQKYGPKKVVVLHDVSLLEDTNTFNGDNLREQLSLNDNQLLLYVGNLQAYQGIDLLLESFALVLEKTNSAEMVIIGGIEADIEYYQEKSRAMGIGHKVHFIGPRPIEHLAAYLAQADILVSPRVKGKNTPMKIYSYLHSGKPLVATELPTHTQLVDSTITELAAPTPETFAVGMLRLIDDASIRTKLGLAAQQFIEESFTFAAFCKKLNHIVDWLEIAVQEQIQNTPAGEPIRTSLREKPSPVAE